MNGIQYGSSSAFSANREQALDILDGARRTLDIEIAALQAMSVRLDNTFVRAVELLLHCTGRVVVSGVGKSGHIGRKLAATLASTGTPAFFVHAAEASHGDLGMITEHDVVIAISYSGTTGELLTVVPSLKRLGTKLIAMTGKPESELALHADVHQTPAWRRKPAR